LDIFESEVIPNLCPTAENSFNCGKFLIPAFSFGQSKGPNVTWIQVRRMRRAYEAFRLEFFLDFPAIISFLTVGTISPGGFANISEDSSGY
jgi:hypothetical protein